MTYLADKTTLVKIWYPVGLVIHPHTAIYLSGISSILINTYVYFQLAKYAPAGIICQFIHCYLWISGYIFKQYLLEQESGYTEYLHGCTQGSYCFCKYLSYRSE